MKEKEVRKIANLKCSTDKKKSIKLIFITKNIVFECIFLLISSLINFIYFNT